MLDIAKLKEYFSYDPDTGDITRLKIYGRSRGCKIGEKVGWTNQEGYKELPFNGKFLKQHRVAWALFHGEQPPEFIDHINMVKTDNRITNLRAATRSQNNANRSAYANNKLGIKGVIKVRDKYRAHCRVDKKRYHLGYHDTLEAAQAAYSDFAQKTFGEYARSNQI